MKTNPKHTMLYFIDGDQLVWLSGNLSKNEIQQTANSLPDIDTTDFPES